MGRHYTGALITKECMRLDLKYLKENKFIQKDRETKAVLSWSTGSKMNFTSVYTDEEKYIDLSYSMSSTGEEENYRIQLKETPSNLGKGSLLYMVCPVSGLKSRKLYLAYGSPIFKSIKAYQNRIYFSSQTSSKNNRFNDKYWELLRELEKGDAKRKQSHYLGKKTKRELSKERKKDRLELYDKKRWEELSPKIQVLASAHGLY